MTTDLLDARPAHDQSVPERDRPTAGRVLAVALPIVLVLVAGALRFYGLGEPDRIYFDETYYANDANEYLARGVEEDFAVHPPVGKWLLASGIATFGFDAYGWRFSAAFAGTATVLVLYLAGLRLFRRRGIAALAALLLTVEGLAFTMSRIAMLDVFLMLFVTLGFGFLLLDRDRQWEGVELLTVEDGPDPERALPRRPHPWRWLAGLAFGLALATKWSAVLPIAAAGLFVLVSELAWRRRLTGRWSVHLGRVVASGLGTLVAVPLLVYVLSYGSWFANYENTRKGADACPDGVCAGVSVVDIGASWLDEQREIANFHRDLEAEHPYRAPAYTWFLMTRPVAYYWEGCDDAEARASDDPCKVAEGNVAEIVGLGNPAIWWLALAAYPVLGWFAVARRDWRAWAILAFLLLQTLPWHLTPRPVFLFYMTPVVPFMCLALAYAAWRAMAVRSLRWLPATLAIVAVVAFLFFYPVLVGTEITRGSWDLRMWMASWV
jgi:dolichyl-phosphate-mannose-protein mannosyltransferase